VSLGSRFASALQCVVLRTHARRAQRPPAIYVGAARSDNVGDRVMFEFVQECAPHRGWMPAEGASRERRLAALRLSGAKYFPSGVLGGGTMMNDYSRAIVEQLLESGVPLRSLGTGVGSGGWDLPDDASGLEPWPRLLARFESVTVRGPRSLETLRKLGFTEARVLGDLALGYTRSDVASSSARPRTILYNLIERGPRERWNEELPHALAAFLQDRHRQGWELRAFAMEPGDARAAEAFASRFRLPPPNPIVPADGKDLVSRMTQAALVVSMRLHGAVFGVAGGAPVVSLGYRAKCADFMESVDASECVLSLDSPGDTHQLRDALERRVEAAVAKAPTAHARALEFASEIREELARL
jgi:hypothetical protein